MKTTILAALITLATHAPTIAQSISCRTLSSGQRVCSTSGGSRVTQRPAGNGVQYINLTNRAGQTLRIQMRRVGSSIYFTDSNGNQMTCNVVGDTTHCYQ